MTSDSETPASRLVIDAVRAALANLPASADSPIAVAFSGGLDSTTLLDAAVRCAGEARVIALHVHHGLSPNADAWAAHCHAFARALGVRFASRQVDVVREGGESLEAAARDARYRALDALCDEQGATTLWLAHHADDQAETVLLQLLRGAGVAGLAAMAPQRADGLSVPRVRPLLHVLRAQLEHYAHQRDLRWIDDESNTDTRYARNALRHDVLPALAVHFPGFRDALARTASHAASAQRLLDELARIDLQSVTQTDDENALTLPAVLALDDERAINLLRYWMRALGLQAASAARMGEILRQLRDAAISRNGHALRIDHAGHCLRVYRECIFWETGDSADPMDLDNGVEAPRTASRLDWTGETIWRLPQWRGTFVFAPVTEGDAEASALADAVPEATLRAEPLTVRSRVGGERVRVSAQGPSRTLKNLFQEQGVPGWKRDVPLLFSGGTLLFVPLIGVNRACWQSDQASGPWRHITWQPDLVIA
ncbi:tRNA(Ile)-lysidine synthetase [Caballeronia sordidicola]|uniref:tRNA(Ile)-lysidine synthase n=1 Tax=Caballeronia sordidicola TaxID=196367 RepID=A0A158ET55_CABSO|nr:tRNA lysidine(34) synthetase TilS [Caballeronia sordidicola]SAL10768.1 tRNA(Ile)-lysidine synthetase [Caballeronia sordidicola]